ncbi:MAG: ATP-binding cassette domain-containing protein [Desulfobacterales bacterium]
MALLELEKVTKRFGGLIAVDRVSLQIKRGQFVGIVGPNGSGKTTLFNCISGVFFPEEGQIIFEGQNITTLPPYKRAPLGIGRTFQIPRPFASASVRENIAVGAMFGTIGSKVNVDQALEFADIIAKRVGLDEHRDKIAIVAMVEHIMRAVVGMAEKVIVLDQGAKIVDAPTQEALQDPKVVEVYLGHPPEG